MKVYCVVYLVCGIHHRYRCTANNKADARKQCRDNMFPDKIVRVEVEE